MVSTTVSRVVRAPRADVYRALLDPAAVQRWMVPDGMTSEVHAFDAVEGGAFRISLTYDDPSRLGKTEGATDSFGGRFTSLVPATRVEQAIAFEADDSEMGGEMTVTYDLADEPGGATLVTGTHANLPSTVDPADNELGWTMSLGKLGALVEDRWVRQLPEAGADQLRAAWAYALGLWDVTIARASTLPETTVHERVGGEWSLVETLRHLVFATDAWVGRMVLRDDQPFHPLGLGWGSFSGSAELGLHRDADPSLAEILAVRSGCVAKVTKVLDGLSDADLDTLLTPPLGIGYPQPSDLEAEDGTVVGTAPLRDCVFTVIEEEYLHNGYAVRDLATLTPA